jgi:hypothetical protein
VRRVSSYPSIFLSAFKSVKNRRNHENLRAIADLA